MTVSEALFHDIWADTIRIDDLLVEESFESPAALENKFILQEVGPLAGKTVLDLGCGAGEASVYFALNGANATALDVSSGMLHKTTELASSRSVEVRTVQGQATDIPLPENVFDLVYANSLLHHVDQSDREKTLCEVQRILKPGGKAVFIDPLAHNPIINIYRRIATQVRSLEEKPLKYSDINLFKKFFPNVQHREFWFSGLFLFMWFYLTGVNPNRYRYWKHIIRQGERLKSAVKLFNLVDRMLLKIPFLRPLCWNTVIIAEKARKEGAAV